MAQASDLEKLAAWLFIKYMLQPEKTADFAMTTGYMPVRQSAYELQDYIDWLEGPTNAAKVHKATSQYASEGWEYFVDAAWAGSSTVRNECETAMIQIMVNATDISQALQDAVGRIG
jgi:multiple sugar transport system substrate-binding protein